jgi:hypothetical protein
MTSLEKELSAAFLADHSEEGATELLKSALQTALRDATYCCLDLYYYAASVSGWNLIAPDVAQWLAGAAGRNVRAWIGVDDAATDPEALRKMLEAGVELYIPVRYSGCFHPKVIALSGPNGGRVLAGSHNLSNAAMVKNLEVSVDLAFLGATPAPLLHWMAIVHAASDRATKALIDAYEKERDAFRKAHPTPSFSWSGRRAPKVRRGMRAVIAAPKDSLIVEITPLETGSGGKQIQPPMAVLTPFFGLPNKQPVSKVVQARLRGAPHYEPRTVRRNANSTGRMHIPELDYDDRPCFMVFVRNHAGFEYEIVSKASEPARYAALVKVAVHQANANARRWVITRKDVV